MLSTWFGILTMLLCTLTLVTSSVFHLQLSTTMQRSNELRMAADSMVSQAFERMLSSQGNFATHQTETLETSWGDIRGSVELHLPVAPQSGYAPGHDPAPVFGVNNLLNDGNALGWNRVVPPFAAQVIGEAQLHNQIVRVEGVLHVPPFQYAIAAAGPVRSTQGNVLIGAVTAPPQNNNIPPLTAGALASNSTSQTAVDLGGGSKVVGDVRACGGVTLDPSDVTGTISQNEQSPIALPQVPISTYKPGSSAMPQAAGTPASYDLTGYNITTGDVAITNDLHLDDALLYVDGNLTVHGHVTGTGAIFVTKAVTIDKGTQVSTSQLIALAAGGDVTLKGQGPNVDSFQGVVYTEGQLHASQITLFGSFVANAPASQGAGGAPPSSNGMTLDNANIVYVPQYATIKFNIITPVSGNVPGFFTAEPTTASGAGPYATLAAEVDTPPGGQIDFSKPQTVHVVVGVTPNVPTNPWDPAYLSTAGVQHFDVTMTLPPPPVQWVQYPGSQNVFNSGTQHDDMAKVVNDLGAMRALPGGYTMPPAIAAFTPPPQLSSAITNSGFPINMAYNAVGPYAPTADEMKALCFQLGQIATKYPAPPAGQQTTTGTTTPFTFDLSQFLQLSDRVHLDLWRIL
jgi:hypothetical protein